MLWVSLLCIIAGSAAEFVKTNLNISPITLGVIGLVSFAICAINFICGGLIGGHKFRREASQSLGQKNTSFTIFLALQFANPLVAMGPTFYVLWHNLWNAAQLFRHDQSARRKKLDDDAETVAAGR